MGKPGVYITREQRDAINYFDFHGWTSQHILKCHLGLVDTSSPTQYLHENLKVIKEMNFDSLAISLYDSYEVEKTPHEKLLEYYNRVNDDYNMVKNGDSIALGIKETLKFLEIDVEGINI